MFEVIILSLALSMDAFAVSIGLGIKNKGDIKILALKAALFFGIFQALMPFIGYLGGIGLKEYIQGYDSIIAFVLLLVIGGKMIYEALNENVEEEITQISNKILLTLAIATSIDALAVGISFACTGFSNIKMLTCPLLIIGFVSFVMSIIGVLLGVKFGKPITKKLKPELLGGVILIFIGIKVLLSHLYGLLNVCATVVLVRHFFLFLVFFYLSL